MASQTTSLRQVFISHAKQDADFAHRLADGLKQLGVSVWIAPDSILPGEGWVKAIERGLRESSHVVIVLTPAALESQWVEKETDVAIALERKGRIKILPLDVKACAVPLFLSTYQMVSFRQDYSAGLSRLARILGLSPASWASLVEAEHEVEQLPAEQAERIAAEQPKVEWLDVARPEPIGRKKPAEQAWNWERLRLPLAVVALLALVIGLVVIRPGGGGEPAPIPTTSVPAVVIQADQTPTATPEPPTATVTPEPPTPTPTLGVGSTRMREKDSMVMVYVPAGDFQMGSEEGVSDEQPVHKVTLDSFWIDRTEVSNAQYARCVKDGKCDQPLTLASNTRSSYYGDKQFDNYPVIFVNWDDAANYCDWVGGQLPTEAQWEYAARGPENRVYPWGYAFDGRKLNYCDVNCQFGHADKAVNDGYADTAPVGSYPSGASWVGALDMAGNVWEMVADRYGHGYPSGPQDNPRGPSSGQDHVKRGGAWDAAFYYVTTAVRLGLGSNERGGGIGFRCARPEGNK
jgi:formylglycine-generating enzyme required for sulfatase activity